MSKIKQVYAVEVAIWFLMADFKQRNAKEITDVIHALGYRLDVIEKHLGKIVRQQSWFETNIPDLYAPSLYVLRKDTLEPSSGKTARVIKSEQNKESPTRVLRNSQIFNLNRSISKRTYQGA